MLVLGHLSENTIPITAAAVAVAAPAAVSVKASCGCGCGCGCVCCGGLWRRLRLTRRANCYMTAAVGQQESRIKKSTSAPGCVKTGSILMAGCNVQETRRGQWGEGAFAKHTFWGQSAVQHIPETFCGEVETHGTMSFLFSHA